MGNDSAVFRNQSEQHPKGIFDVLQSIKYVGMIEFKIVEDQLFGQVMQKFGTLVEKSRVILVTLGYEELSFLVSASLCKQRCV